MAKRPDRSTTVSESFKSRADSAAFWEAHAASQLSRAGLYVTSHPFTLAAETGRSIASYGESHDLEVATCAPRHLNYAPEEVEVKSLNLSFTNPSDYPYGKVLVCSQASFIRKWPGSSRVGRHFLMVSRETGVCLWLPAGSNVHLGDEVLDTTRNELYKVVKADRSSLCTLSAFVEYLKEPWPTPRDSNPEELA